MSDDLISRKALINILKGVDKDGLLTINQIIDFIEDQPTAFDKERVIEKIKDESSLERFEDVGISGNVYSGSEERTTLPR